MIAQKKYCSISPYVAQNIAYVYYRGDMLDVMD
jgi:hypothetical protein